jgi:protein-S-isoprenylcysteine O-methyltransferase Ste14
MYQSHPAFTRLLLAWAVTALAASVALPRIPAPYGHFARPGWGPKLPPRLAWFLMESPGLWVFLAMFLASLPCPPVPVLFAVLWMGHYLYRGFIYPARIRSTRAVPVVIVLMAVGFHLATAGLQTWELYRVKPDRPVSWLWDPRFLVGAAMFAGGFILAVQADSTLRALRPTRGQQYQVPRGGMFERVSCPHYLGEIIEWTGWAILTWTWAGLVFALWTAANLVPRARALHRAYREQFPDYPPDRNALIPHVW